MTQLTTNEFICAVTEGYAWSDTTHTCVNQFNARKAAGQPPCAAGYCNPVNVSTGNKYQREVDYAGAGSFPLRFERHYNSAPVVTSTRIGTRWRHTYDRSVVEVDASTVDVYRADGKVLTFTESGGNWIPDADVTDRLVPRVGGGWHYFPSDNTIEEYDDAGRLVAIVNPQGLVQNLVYDLPSGSGGDDDDDTLDKVLDPFGRSLRLIYAGGRVETLLDPAGNEFEYSYGAAGNLESVAYPDPNPGNGPDVRTYHYEDGAFPNALTGITDENGNRFATFDYDGFGRSTRSEHAGGADSADFVYNADGTTTVTEASGNVQTLEFEPLLGLLRPEAVSGGPCSTCSGQSADTRYDADGFVIAVQDFNGNITSYERDPGGRGLEIERTEG